MSLMPAGTLVGRPWLSLAPLFFSPQSVERITCESLVEVPGSYFFPDNFFSPATIWFTLVWDFMSYPITAFSAYASISDSSFPPLPTHVAFIIRVFTFCQVRAECVAGICVNFLATVFDNSHVIIAIVIVLTFSATVSSFTVLWWFVSCFEIFGVFENSISWRDPWRRLPFSFPIFWFSLGGLWKPPQISKKLSLWLLIRGVVLFEFFSSPGSFIGCWNEFQLSWKLWLDLAALSSWTLRLSSLRLLSRFKKLLCNKW